MKIGTNICIAVANVHKSMPHNEVFVHIVVLLKCEIKTNPNGNKHRVCMAYFLTYALRLDALFCWYNAL